MSTSDSSDYRRRDERYSVVSPWFRRGLIVIGILGFVAVDPVVAQSAGEAFCDSSMAKTIKNLFTLIQFGGPLLGGVLALGATVAMPTIRQTDQKKDLKTLRDQGVVWGVIVAPLGTTILQFLLNNIVAGGVSCGF